MDKLVQTQVDLLDYISRLGKAIDSTDTKGLSSEYLKSIIESIKQPLRLKDDYHRVVFKYYALRRKVLNENTKINSN